MTTAKPTMTPAQEAAWVRSLFSPSTLVRPSDDREPLKAPSQRVRERRVSPIPPERHPAPLRDPAPPSDLGRAVLAAWAQPAPRSERESKRKPKPKQFTQRPAGPPCRDGSYQHRRRLVFSGSEQIGTCTICGDERVYVAETGLGSWYKYPAKPEGG